MSRTVLDGRYVRLGRLGGGGMAEVYLVLDELLDREVAFKVPRRRRAASAEFVERFRREARHVAALSHPNIVQVYDAGETSDGTPYMAMEYVPGGTLRDRLDERGALPGREAATLALQISDALGAAHASGVVHRDVKPENVLVSESGEAKVADFGIARATDATAMTKSCHVLGTVRYLSPEQAMGREVTPASDLYSLGVVLYEALTGAPPFEAEGTIAVAMKHLTQEPRPPRELEPSVPVALEAITLKLLRKRPEERYASAAELAGDLERFLVGDLLPSAAQDTVRMPAVAAPEEGGRPERRAARSRKRRSRALVAALLAASLAGIAVSIGTAAGIAEPTTGRPLLAHILSPEEAKPLGRVISPSTPAATGGGGGIEVPPRERAKKEVREKSGPEQAKSPAEEEPAKAPASGAPVAREALVARWTPPPSQAPLTTVAVPSVAVPSVVGLSLEEAGAVLGEVGLSLEVGAYEASETVPEGAVVSQQPAPGYGARPGTGVSVTVSSGPSDVPAPAAAPAAEALAGLDTQPVRPPRIEIPAVGIRGGGASSAGVARAGQVRATALAERALRRAGAGE